MATRRSAGQGSSASIFAQHHADVADAALKPAAADDSSAASRHGTGAANSSNNRIATNPGNNKLSTVGTVAVFLLFPLGMGTLGLSLSYLETWRKPEKELSFDRDFVLPFLLALAMAVVVGFQTAGYRKRQIDPLVTWWPKVNRVKKSIKVPKGSTAVTGGASRFKATKEE